MLRRAGEFRTVYEKGTRTSSRCFVVFTLPNTLNENRFGLTTSRKLGKAHERNRIRRRIREIIRTTTATFPRGVDWVINPRRAVLERPFSELQSELLKLMGAAT